MTANFVLVLISSLACSAAIGAPDKAPTVGGAALSAAQTNERPALPLDHGPRAVTTPWLNQQRLAAMEAAKQERKSGQVGVAKSQ